ncbi:Haloacid type II [Mycena venus]|uniref:Haloacid type II n=1 Tax=Mycena venus TaxID=2733690 RepID=A0A8H6Y9P8_9AGAR|nr:Haloacid type II [Mycena venus]
MADLTDVKALLFDCFGTVVDWRGSVTRQLELVGREYGIGWLFSSVPALLLIAVTLLADGNWKEFAHTWRVGYIENTISPYEFNAHPSTRIAAGGKGPLNIDVMHRQILEQILGTPEWKALGDKLDTEARDKLTLVWHRLDGWLDTTPGLYELKREVIIGTLSNANGRLLVDMAKYADLPWDIVFSSEFFSSFKPDPKVYLGGVENLSLQPHECAMVAAHVNDLLAAEKLGMRTIYIPRPEEELEFPDVGEVKPKTDGGSVDLVVHSFTELAGLLAQRFKK